jgi:hypothetical protein
VRVQVVQHHVYHFRLRIAFIYELAHLLGEIHFGALLGDGDVPPGGLRFNAHKPACRAVTLVLVIIIFGDLSCLRRQGGARFFDELLVRLVEVHLRAFRVVGRGVQVEDVFHRCDERAADCR